MIKKPTVISTFAGCGGSSLGYKWAGYEELLAIDFEKNAVETFKLNFPGVSIWQRDIATVTGREILQFCGLKKGELGILDGSPPCQGFSTSGKRQINDPRNDLFKEFSRLVTELEPQVFVMENVSGMFKGKMRGRFIEVIKTLKSLNYDVSCSRLNAKYFGVPQSRERLIFIGIRKDLGVEPEFPVSWPVVTTVGQALEGLQITEPRELPSRVIILRALLRCKEGETAAKHNHGMFFNWQRIAWNEVCPTITKTPCLFHWNENRFLTIQELKRLSSFPDDFQFIGSHRQQWARIGNAVMPKFMEAIANRIKETVFDPMIYR